MREISYIRVNPTGNITILVTSPVQRPLQAETAAKIMSDLDCEQVGFVEKPVSPLAAARLQMMGGEFCGNATMSLAACLAAEKKPEAGECLEIPLEVSGAEGLLTCRVTVRDGYYEGTVRMPRIFSAEEKDGCVIVRMDGIAHIITGTDRTKAEAEAFLVQKAAAFTEEAVGLLHWKNGCLTPLVYVKPTGTMVWESGCGSGSTAVAAYEALKNGQTVTRIAQPGGIMTVETDVENGTVTKSLLTGHVVIEKTGRYNV